MARAAELEQLGRVLVEVSEDYRAVASFPSHNFIYYVDERIDMGLCRDEIVESPAFGAHILYLDDLARTSIRAKSSDEATANRAADVLTHVICSHFKRELELKLAGG